jgi:hypothetical protein
MSYYIIKGIVVSSGKIMVAHHLRTPVGVGTLVGSLFFGGSPPHLSCDAISLEGLIAEIVVNSVNGMSRRRPGAHILQEPLKTKAIWVAFMPLSAYADAATTVVLVGFMTGVLTTEVHHLPDAIFLVVDGLNGFATASAMRLRISGSNEIVRGDGFTLSADTLDADSFDEVCGSSLAIVSHSLDDGEITEFVSG